MLDILLYIYSQFFKKVISLCHFKTRCTFYIHLLYSCRFMSYVFKKRDILISSGCEERRSVLLHHCSVSVFVSAPLVKHWTVAFSSLCRFLNEDRQRIPKLGVVFCPTGTFPSDSSQYFPHC